MFDFFEDGLSNFHGLVWLVSFLGGQFLPASTHGLRQVLQHRLGIFPVDARVRDADAVFETGLALRRHLLVAW